MNWRLVYRISVFLSPFLLLFAFNRPSISWGDNLKEEILSEIEKRYQKVITLSGEFKQVMPLQGMGITREARGFFFIFKPGKSRWEYVEPLKQVFIVDGDYLYFKKEEDANFRQNRIEGQLVGIYNTLLGGEGDLFKIFNLSRSSRVKIGGKDYLEVELIPDGKFRQDVKRVVFIWNRETKLIERLTIFSLSGTSNTLYFEDVVVNRPIPSSLFITN